MSLRLEDFPDPDDDQRWAARAAGQPYRRRPAPTPPRGTIAWRLGVVRRLLGLSVTALGERAELSRGHYERIEAGERNPSLPVIRSLLATLRAAGYDVLTDWLLFGEGPPSAMTVARLEIERRQRRIPWCFWARDDWRANGTPPDEQPPDRVIAPLRCGKLEQRSPRRKERPA